MATNITIPELVKGAGLNVDQADLVQELLSSREAYGAYIKVVRKMVEKAEYAVVTMSSAEGQEAIFHAKLRAEGARKLLTEMERLITRKHS